MASDRARRQAIERQVASFESELRAAILAGVPLEEARLEIASSRRDVSTHGEACAR